MVISGLRAIEEFLRAQPAALEGLHAGGKNSKTQQSCVRVLTLYYAAENARIKRLLGMAAARGIRITHTTCSVLDKLARSLPPALRDHRGILAVLSSPSATPQGSHTRKKRPAVDSSQERTLLHALATHTHALVLVLDAITDPHNVGAIVRSADQFSVDAVLLPHHHGAGGTETITRVSAGAVAWVPLVRVRNLVRTAGILKRSGFWLYGADVAGEAIGARTFPPKTALVLGNEGHGVSPLLRTHCDALISIPTQGNVDSLNVSVAAGILLYEIRRSQQSPYSVQRQNEMNAQ